MQFPSRDREIARVQPEVVVVECNDSVAWRFSASTSLRNHCVRSAVIRCRHRPRNYRKRTLASERCRIRILLHSSQRKLDGYGRVQAASYRNSSEAVRRLSSRTPPGAGHTACVTVGTGAAWLAITLRGSIIARADRSVGPDGWPDLGGFRGSRRGLRRIEDP